MRKIDGEMLKRRAECWAVWAAFATALLVGCQPSGWRRPESEPFAVAFWYWSSPAEFAPDTVKKLQEINVNRLVVRTFTLSYDGDQVVPILRQRFVSSPGAPPIILTANLDAGMVRHFREADLATMVRVLRAEFREAESKATEAGFRVIGWQLDFDVPTSQLPKYAELLQQLRPDCKGELSISGLQTWMGSARLADVLASLDAWYPQFYEGDLARTPDDRQTLSNLSKEAASVAKFGKPFWIGVASYQSCLAFDGEGKRQGIVQGMNLNQAGGRFKSGPEWASDRGERAAVFSVDQGPRRGWKLRIAVPTVESLKRDIELARSTGARGVCIFRLPSAVDRSALPLASLVAAWRGDPLTVKIVPTLAGSERTQFGLIENPTGNEPFIEAGRREYRIKNEGNQDSGPITLQIEGLDRSATVNAGSFRDLNRGRKYQLYGLGAGETASFGPVLFDSPTPPKISAQYVDPTGKPQRVELK